MGPEEFLNGWRPDGDRTKTTDRDRTETGRRPDGDQMETRWTWSIIYFSISQLGLSNDMSLIFFQSDSIRKYKEITNHGATIDTI